MLLLPWLWLWLWLLLLLVLWLLSFFTAIAVSMATAMAIFIANAIAISIFMVSNMAGIVTFQVLRAFAVQDREVALSRNFNRGYIPAFYSSICLYSFVLVDSYQ